MSKGIITKIPFLLLYIDFGLNYKGKGKGKAALIQTWIDP